jgi:Arc/MetJ-type ribon-helix-helix transcriptional regulator
MRYHSGMSRQLTVRLPDDLVEFIDERVERGHASGRAAVVAAALERERRRQVAERDAAILAKSHEQDDLDELAALAARTKLDDLA